MAKKAFRLKMLIGFADHAKVRGIPVALHGVAGVAKRFEIARIVCAAFVAGDDMIDFQSFDIG